MSTTLIAVVVALVLGHVAPALAASVRDYGWFGQWTRWLGSRMPDEGFWRGRYGIVLALLPPVLAVGLSPSRQAARPGWPTPADRRPAL